MMATRTALAAVHVKVLVLCSDGCPLLNGAVWPALTTASC